MYLDSQLLYSDGQALTATAVSTNIVDHDSDRDFGIGQPMCLVIAITVAAGGTTPTLQVTLQTDTTSAFGAPVSVVSTQVFAAAALTAGARFALPVPPDTTLNRWTRVNYTMTGTSPTVTVITALIPQYMLQAEQYGTSGCSMKYG